MKKYTDGGLGCVGTVVELGEPGSKRTPDNTVVVCWDSGSRSNYRTGYQGQYDLIMVDNAQCGTETVTHNYFCVITILIIKFWIFLQGLVTRIWCVIRASKIKYLECATSVPFAMIMIFVFYAIILIFTIWIILFSDLTVSSLVG